MQQLDWLPITTELADAISAARQETDCKARLAAAIHLAGYRRDLVATERLDRLAREGLQAPAEALHSLGLTPLRLAMLGSHTLDHLAPAVRVAGLQRRVALTLYTGPYGLYRQALLGDDPDLDRFAPQVLLLALDAHDLALDLPLEAPEARVREAVDEQVNELRRLWRLARARFGAQVIQQTLLPAEPDLFGSFEAMVPASPLALIERTNAAIRAAAREERVLLLDLAWHAANSVPPVQFMDLVRWHHAKQLISPALAPLYGDLLARIAAAIAGLSRKCLVLDLDNTLWGGVVGEDGIDAIRIGQGSAEGEAFLAFQRYVVRLARRGIILAVCSKNESALADAAFRGRSEMMLRREDIAEFVCNWEDKAANMRAIARKLDIGLDSMVFVDDTPAERDIIRRELPEVAVPEMPADVAHYPSLLARAGYFEAVSFTRDDVARTQSYALNTQRRTELERATDLDSYRKSLAMKMTAARISSAYFPRVLQLINKTNQFNLTTRRYTEAELLRLLAATDTLPLCLHLRDRFGDNGLISVILARSDTMWPDGELLIDTWLMSCRVLGRQVEAAALEVLANEARRDGASCLIGEYRPTPRNGLVSDHYAKLGFAPCAAPAAYAGDGSFWRYDLENGPRPSHFIQWEVTA